MTNRCFVSTEGAEEGGGNIEVVCVYDVTAAAIKNNGNPYWAEGCDRQCMEPV